MESETLRRSYTSRASLLFQPITDSTLAYSVLMINMGSNPISSLEIVSSLNSFNLGRWNYSYATDNCVTKYNPKVYLGAVQTTSSRWNYDYDENRKGELGGTQKSGSWPYNYDIENLGIL